MIETLIAILIALGLNFTKAENGTLLIDSGSKAKLEESADYQKAVSNFTQKEESPIVVIPDIDPIESPIVVIPDIDPVSIN